MYVTPHPPYTVYEVDLVAGVPRSVSSGLVASRSVRFDRPGVVSHDGGTVRDMWVPGSARQVRCLSLVSASLSSARSTHVWCGSSVSRFVSLPMMDAVKVVRSALTNAGIGFLELNRVFSLSPDGVSTSSVVQVLFCVESSVPESYFMSAVNSLLPTVGVI